MAVVAPFVAVQGNQASDLILSIKPIEKYFKFAYLIIFSVIIIFSASTSCLKHVCENSSFVSTLSVSLMALICATLVGLLFGFIFGIPKSVQNAAAGQDIVVPATAAEQELSAGRKRPSNRSHTTNTSLEEISDWLTKIIIGLGLVQFREVIQFIVNAANYCASFISAKSVADVYDGTTPLPFFVALILSGLLSGLLFSYLQTRVRLTLIFITAEKTFGTEEAGQLVASGLRSITENDGASDRRGAPRPSPATAMDERLASIGRSEIADPKELVGWASAQARLGNLVVAEDALRDALQRDPNNLDIYMRIADVRRLRQNHAGAIEIILEGAAKASTTHARIGMLHRGILTALYLPAPEGFRQAIALSDALIKQNPVVDPSVYLWRAAAFGQNVKWLKEAGVSEGQDVLRVQAIEAIRALIAMRPDVNASERILLRSMFRPSQAEREAGEDDLAVFGEDAEFVALIDGA